MRPSPHRRFRIGAVSSRAVGTVALLTLALSAAGCATDEGATVRGAKLVKKGQLTTCTHLPYAPFQLEQSGKVVGFDVDMIDLVAKQLGVPQRVVDTSFETIKTGSALNSGKCDVAAAGMTITPERARFIDFSAPYFKATQALMTKKGSGITSLAAAKDKKLGSQAGTTGEEYAREQGLDPQSFENSQAELDGLRTGQVDVIVQDEPVVRYWLKDKANSTFALTASLQTNEEYGYAVRKGGNPALLKYVNDAIAKAKQDGTYKRIYEKWMGPMPAGALP
jgi:polar amino acid transport system substrate-binding protein